MRWQGLAMRAISGCVSLTRLPFASPRGLRIFIYHAICSPVYRDRFGLNTIKEERFREHVDILADMLTMPLLPLKIPHNELRIAITFDDGYADNLYVAAPILVEKSLPFTVFITSDFIRKKVKGFLSPNELKQLSLVPGATIGSHSKTHRHLSNCDDEELRSEMVDSKHYLEDLIGKPVTSIAYPYGSANLRVRHAAEKAGYQVGTCSRFTINHPDRDNLMLNRCIILNSDTPRVLHQKLHGDWDWFRRRKPDPLLVFSSEGFH